MSGKRRLDELLVDRGHAETRTKAQALILAGLVFDGGGHRLDKAGHGGKRRDAGAEGTDAGQDDTIRGPDDIGIGRHHHAFGTGCLEGVGDGAQIARAVIDQREGISHRECPWSKGRHRPCADRW